MVQRKRFSTARVGVLMLMGTLMWTPTSFGDFVWRDDSVRFNDNWSDPANWDDDQVGTPKGAAPGAVVTETMFFPTTTATWGTSVMDDGNHELQAGLRMDRFRGDGTLDLDGNTLSITGGIASFGGGRTSITITNGQMVFGSLSTAVSVSFYNTLFMTGGNSTTENVIYTASSTVRFRNVTDMIVAFSQSNRGVSNVTVDLSAATVFDNTISLAGDMIVGYRGPGGTSGITALGTAKLPGTLTTLTVGDELIVAQHLRSNNTTSNLPSSATGILDLGGGSSLDLTTKSLILGQGDKATGSIINVPTTLNLSVGTLSSPGIIYVGYNDRTQGIVDGDNPTSGSLTSLGGTFDADLTELRIGENTQPGAGGAATGTLDLSASTLGTLDVTGGAGAITVGVGLDANGTLKLSGGNASATTLTVGSTDAGSTALVDLAGTTFAIDSALSIDGPSDDQGVVITRIQGLSAGLDLATGATLTIGSGGLLNIRFEQDPPLVPGDLYFGLRWQGDRVADLEALSLSGGLTITNNTVLNISIFELDGFTYVGAVVPEPLSATVMVFGVLMIIRRRLKTT